MHEQIFQKKSENSQNRKAFIRLKMFNSSLTLHTKAHHKTHDLKYAS